MHTHSLQEFNAEVVRFVASLVPGTAATVVALSGDLGAGKTTFAQAAARYFGIDEQVTSPTFVIEKIYPIREAAPSNGAGDIREGAFKRLIHIDAYRLKEERELETLGWRELLTDSGTLILIEWPERVPGLLPADTHHVKLLYIDEDVREISYDR